MSLNNFWVFSPLSAKKGKKFLKKIKDNYLIIKKWDGDVILDTVLDAIKEITHSHSEERAIIKFLSSEKGNIILVKYDAESDEELLNFQMNFKHFLKDKGFDDEVYQYFFTYKFVVENIPEKTSVSSYLSWYLTEQIDVDFVDFAEEEVDFIDVSGDTQDEIVLPSVEPMEQPKKIRLQKKHRHANQKIEKKKKKSVRKKKKKDEIKTLNVLVLPQLAVIQGFEFKYDISLMVGDYYQIMSQLREEGYHYALTKKMGPKQYIVVVPHKSVPEHILKDYHISVPAIFFAEAVSPTNTLQGYVIIENSPLQKGKQDITFMVKLGYAVVYFKRYQKVDISDIGNLLMAVDEEVDVDTWEIVTMNDRQQLFIYKELQDDEYFDQTLLNKIILKNIKDYSAVVEVQEDDEGVMYFRVMTRITTVEPLIPFSISTLVRSTELFVYTLKNLKRAIILLIIIGFIVGIYPVSEALVKHMQNVSRYYSYQNNSLESDKIVNNVYQLSSQLDSYDNVGYISNVIKSMYDMFPEADEIKYNVLNRELTLIIPTADIDKITDDINKLSEKKIIKEVYPPHVDSFSKKTVFKFVISQDYIHTMQTSSISDTSTDTSVSGVGDE